MSEEGTVIPGEGTEQHNNPDLVREKARQKGWKDRHETNIPEEDWIDAREFLGRQKLFDQIHDLKRELGSVSKKHQTEIAQVSEYLAKMQKVEYEKAMRQLKAEKKLAIEDSNIAAVEQINEEIQEKEKEFQKSQAEVPKAQQGPDPEIAREFAEWKDQNKWFDSDKDLQKEALALGTGYAINNPTVRHSDVLDYVEKKIKKLYPEKFEMEQPKEKKQTQVEGGGITHNSGTTTRKKGLSIKDLSDTEVEVMRTLIKRNALKDKAAANKISQEEQYLRDIAEVKELR